MAYTKPSVFYRFLSMLEEIKIHWLTVTLFSFLHEFFKSYFKFFFKVVGKYWMLIHFILDVDALYI